MHTMYMSQPAPATSGPYPSMPGAAAGNGVGVGRTGGGPTAQMSPGPLSLSSFIISV